jgi:hypothetical protein
MAACDVSDYSTLAFREILESAPERLFGQLGYLLIHRMSPVSSARRRRLGEELANILSAWVFADLGYCPCECIGSRARARHRLRALSRSGMGAVLFLQASDDHILCRTPEIILD